MFSLQFAGVYKAPCWKFYDAVERSIGTFRIFSSIFVGICEEISLLYRSCVRAVVKSRNTARDCRNAFLLWSSKGIVDVVRVDGWEYEDMNPYRRVDIIKFEPCIMDDALFFHKIYRAAFIILDTKAFPIFALNDVLNDKFEHVRMNVCIYLQFARLYNCQCVVIRF